MLQILITCTRGTMIFTARNHSTQSFGSMAIAPRFALMSIAFATTFFLVGCFDQELTDKMNESADRVCSGVTEENWGQTHDMCLGRAMYMFNDSSMRTFGGPFPNQVRACSVGGLPRFCEDRDTEFMIWTPSGHPVIFNQTLADRARKAAVYFDIEPKEIAIRVLLTEDQGTDLWFNPQTIEVEQSKYPKPPSTDYMGFVGFRSPRSPTEYTIYDVGSNTSLAQNVVIELEYPEANIKIVIEDSTDSHCSGYIQSDGDGIIVIVNNGECRSAITRLTYDYTAPDLHGF